MTKNGVVIDRLLRALEIHLFFGHKNNSTFILLLFHEPLNAMHDISGSQPYFLLEKFLIYTLWQNSKLNVLFVNKNETEKAFSAWPWDYIHFGTFWDLSDFLKLWGFFETFVTFYTCVTFWDLCDFLKRLELFETFVTFSDFWDFERLMLNSPTPNFKKSHSPIQPPLS